MSVIAVANQKGGVGKTTTTLNLGAALREAGKSVLLLDLDPQGNLTVAAGMPNIDEQPLTIGDLLLAASMRGGKAPPLRQAILETPAGLPLVPSNSRLSAAELAMVSALSREQMLRSLLEPVRHDYDYVLIDCLPSLGLVVINALTAADGLIVPVQADFLAMQGLGQILETVAAVQDRLNPALEVYGILLTLVDARTSHAREVVTSIREGFKDVIHVFECEVRTHVALKDSSKAGQSILDFSPTSEAARAYRRLAAEVLAATSERPAAEQPAAAAVAAPTTEPRSPVAPGVEAVSATPEPSLPASEHELVAVAAMAEAPTAEPVTMLEVAAVTTLKAAAAPAATPEHQRAQAPVSVASLPEPVAVAPVAAPARPAREPGRPTLAARVRANDLAARGGTPAEPVAQASAEAVSIRPAAFAEFVARRLQWLGSNATETR